eukprot:TRINITY_DN77550_c0_g1_i1.p1 TRINITY_DN77550_c0_g1~~TRINITY_DN77550_c0_g1_i1.p1  ORF type:complete len:555 (-),score=62.96 TRINITY_DN77550_c0_g1_i1:43-1707(-)
MMAQATWAHHSSPRVCEVSVRRPKALVELPDDMVLKVVEFAFDLLLDVLGLAVVSRQYGYAAHVTARQLLQRPDASWLLTERMASHFPHWSKLSMRGSLSSENCQEGLQIPEDDAVVYHCSRCRSPILRTKDIVSTNYHGARGPAFLVSHLYNTVVERVPYSAAFVTGAYSVCNVACAGCSIPIAKKYVDAREPSNRYKVGKFLLERTLIFAPQCCASTVSNQVSSPRGHSGERPSSHSSPSSAEVPSTGAPEVCVRCFRHLECRTTQAVLLITGCLQPGPSRKLREILISEERLFGDLMAVANGDPQRPASGRSKADQFGGLQGALPWKLLRLCSALSGEVPARLILLFAERLAMTLTSTAASVSSPTHRDAGGAVLSRRHSACEGACAERRTRTPDRRRAGSAGPAKTHLERPTSAPILPSKGAGSLNVLAAAAGVDHTLLSAFSSGDEDAPLGASSEAFRPEVMRWALVAPAASASCRNVEDACEFLTVLREEWQPDWPEERPGIERVIELISARLGLSAKGTAQLWKVFGVKVQTRSTRCWNPFSFCMRS